MRVGIDFGIDTSNYTTSAAAVTTAGEVFCAKRLLAVPPGDRGLRQSDALFCHTKNLPDVISEVLGQVEEACGTFQVLSVGVSDRPRPVEGSYMPCFLAGVNAAFSAARLQNVPLFSFSHQEGHIEAAKKSAPGGFPHREFYAFHLSGGTTEFLRVREKGAGYEVSLLARALDLTCGQLIDRCGVKIGLPFPAGAALEKLAEESEKKFRVKIPEKEGGINLSGFENRFEKLLAAGEKREDLAKYVFTVTEEAARTLLSFGDEESPVLFSGGVSASRLLRRAFSGERFSFAAPEYASDNAVGIAYLAGKGRKNGSA